MKRTTRFLMMTDGQKSVILKELWSRGRTSALLLEGCWFYSPGLHGEVSLGEILNPELLLMCWSAPCMAATVIRVWMYVWITVSHFGQRCKCTRVSCTVWRTTWGSICKSFIQVKGQVMDNIRYIKTQRRTLNCRKHFQKKTKKGKKHYLYKTRGGDKDPY